MKKLTKSQNRKICGVCGGIAEYFECDPTLIRVLWALFSLTGGAGVIAYIVAALIIPDF